MKKKSIYGLILFVVMLAAACFIIMTGDYSYKNGEDVVTGSGDKAVSPTVMQVSDAAANEIVNCNYLKITTPPDINISVEGLGLDYIIQDSQWGSKSGEASGKEAYRKIMKKNQFIPTFQVNGLEDEYILNNTQNNKKLMVDFGNSVPDDIQIYDDMLDDTGSFRYNMSTMQPEYSLDGNQLHFNLHQHMAYYLSSNSEDYKKDWLRLFRIVCKWGEYKCTYAFLINTGMTEVLTEITDHEFLDCEGTYSQLSSSWGIGLTIDSTNLPEHYIIEWQASDGVISVWNDKCLSSFRPYDFNKKHNGYPMTCSKDSGDEVIWKPLAYDKNEDVTIKAYVYENEMDKSPVAYSTITLENKNGVFQKKNIPSKLTLENVKQLSKKGDKLSWEDFKAYEGIETGSGLYIMIYPIDDKYKLWIGGGSPKKKPMYIYLEDNTNIDNPRRIDIRYEDIDKFITEAP